MAIKLGSLLIDLVLGTNRFNQGATSARRSVNTLKKDAEQSFTRIKSLTGDVTGSMFSLKGALVAAAGPAAMGLLVKQSFSAIDALAKQADKVNLTTEALAGLQHATKLYTTAGVGAMTEAITKAEKRLGEFAANGGGAAAVWLKTFSFDIDKLRQLKGEELFATYAEAIRGLSDRGQQLAAISALMGDESRQLIGIVDAGAEAMNEAAAEARAFGLAISRVDAAKIEAANDNFTRTGAVIRGIANTIAIELSPYITAVTGEFINAAKETGGFKDEIHAAANAGVSALITVLETSKQVVGFIDQNQSMAWGGVIGYMLLGKKGLAIGAAIGSAIDGVKKSLGTGNYIADTFRDVNAEIFVTESRIRALQKTLSERGQTVTGKVQDFFSFIGIGASREEVEQNITNLKMHMDELQGRMIALREGMAADPAAQDIIKNQANDTSTYSSAVDKLVAALNNAKIAIDNIKETGGLAGALSLAGDATGPGADIENFIEKQNAALKQVEQSQYSGVEAVKAAYMQRLRIVNDSLERELISEERAVKIKANLAKQAAERITQIEQQEAGKRIAIAMTVTNATLASLQGLVASQIALEQQRGEKSERAARKAFKETQKLQKAQTIMNTASGIIRAFADMPYWAAVPVSAIIAETGRRQLAVINSQTFSGGGGSVAASVPTVSAATSANIPANNFGVDQTDQQAQGAQRVVNFYISGAITRELARDLAGYIKEDINDYDFVLIENYSQNGQKLSGAA